MIYIYIYIYLNILYKPSTIQTKCKGWENISNLNRFSVPQVIIAYGSDVPFKFAPIRFLAANNSNWKKMKRVEYRCQQARDDPISLSKYQIKYNLLMPIFMMETNTRNTQF